jgi:hypothetical protein
VGDIDGEMSMSPVAMRTMKLRVIELEGMNQTLREELCMSFMCTNCSAIRRRERDLDSGKQRIEKPVRSNQGEN